MERRIKICANRLWDGYRTVGCTLSVASWLCSTMGRPPTKAAATGAALPPSTSDTRSSSRLSRVHVLVLGEWDIPVCSLNLSLSSPSSFLAYLWQRKGNRIMRSAQSVCVCANFGEIQTRTWRRFVKNNTNIYIYTHTHIHICIYIYVCVYVYIYIYVYTSNKMQRYTVYFIWKLLYMFRVVPPPIIRSANNCIYSIWYLSHRYCYLPL